MGWLVGGEGAAGEGTRLVAVCQAAQCFPFVGSSPCLASLDTAPHPHAPPPPAELGSVDEGLRQRMLAMFPPAEGAALGTLPSLHAVIVELDGRFITGGLNVSE